MANRDDSQPGSMASRAQQAAPLRLWVEQWPPCACASRAESAPPGVGASPAGRTQGSPLPDMVCLALFVSVERIREVVKSKISWIPVVGFFALVLAFLPSGSIQAQSASRTFPETGK